MLGAGKRMRQRHKKIREQKSLLIILFSFLFFFNLSFALKEETELLLQAVLGDYLDLLADKTASSLFRKGIEQI